MVYTEKIVYRTNMEKTAQRNIMAIYEDWRIFRKILKHDLALDIKSSSGVWRYLVSVRIDISNLVGEAAPSGILVSGGDVGEPKG